MHIHIHICALPSKSKGDISLGEIHRLPGYKTIFNSSKDGIKNITTDRIEKKIYCEIWGQRFGREGVLISRNLIKLIIRGKDLEIELGLAKVKI